METSGVTISNSRASVFLYCSSFCKASTSTAAPIYLPRASASDRNVVMELENPGVASFGSICVDTVPQEMVSNIRSKNKIGHLSPTHLLLTSASMGGSPALCIKPTVEALLTPFVAKVRYQKQCRPVNLSEHGTPGKYLPISSFPNEVF